MNGAERRRQEKFAKRSAKALPVLDAHGAFAEAVNHQKAGRLQLNAMSGYGYKRKFWGPLIFVRFTPESGHRRPAADPTPVYGYTP